MNKIGLEVQGGIYEGSSRVVDFPINVVFKCKPAS